MDHLEVGLAIFNIKIIKGAQADLNKKELINDYFVRVGSYKRMMRRLTFSFIHPHTLVRALYRWRIFWKASLG